jgi:hypothetical protein
MGTERASDPVVEILARVRLFQLACRGRTCSGSPAS